MKRPLLLVALLLLVTGCSTDTDAGHAGPGPGGSRWRPRPGIAWQWQLTGRVDTSVDVPVYDIDGFDQSEAVVSALHDRGRKVICLSPRARSRTGGPTPAGSPGR